MSIWEITRRQQGCAEVRFGSWVRGNTPPLWQENRGVGWGASELMTLISTDSLFVRIQLPVWLGAFWFKSDPYPVDIVLCILMVSLPLVSYTLHAAAVRGWEEAATHSSRSATPSWRWTAGIVHCTLRPRFVYTCGIFYVITRTFLLQPRYKIQLSFLATPQGMLWPQKWCKASWTVTRPLNGGHWHFSLSKLMSCTAVHKLPKINISTRNKKRSVGKNQ